MEAMSKRVLLILAAVLCLGAFAGTSSASAVSEFGTGCTGTSLIGNTSYVSIKHGYTNPLSLTAAISGVVTEWRLNADVPVDGKDEAGQANAERPTLGIYRSTGGTSYQLVGESFGAAPLNFHGTTTNLSRIPVQAGDYLGFAGNVALHCESKDVNEQVGQLSGSLLLGGAGVFETVYFTQLPLVARVEPDVDGDGYGDETQDACPQSAAYQTACPKVKLSSRAAARPGAVLAYITADLAAPVKAKATVYLPGGKKTTLTAPARSLKAGHLATFKLKLTGKVAKVLASLPKAQALQVKVIATATNLTGKPTTSVSRTKLRGDV
jgi:hypothetical protein